MEREVLFTITYYVPLNIKYSEIVHYCNVYEIEMEKTNKTREYKFTGKSEHKLNILGVKHLLKPRNYE